MSVHLQFYESAWPQVLHAVATLLKASDEQMTRAMDGADPSDTRPSSEPALFFWTTFGIAFETLCRPAAVGQVSASGIQSIALDALSGLLRPEISGPVLQDEAIFEEICNLLFRLGLTEGLAIKIRVLEIAVALSGVVVEAAPVAAELRADKRLKQCLQLATTVVREILPSSSSSVKGESAKGSPPLIRAKSGLLSAVHAHTLSAHAECVKRGFALYADLADQLPASLRTELYAIAFHLYSRAYRCVEVAHSRLWS